jgi:spore coat protein U-like protein
MRIFFSPKWPILQTRFALPACLLGAMLVALPAAHAATVTSNLTITALVPAACEIAASGVSFGTYTGTQEDVTATISITCTVTTPWNVGLNAGQAQGATITSRKLHDGASTLDYALFSDSARTTNWGESVGTNTVAGTGSGTAQLITVYGQLAPGQFVKPGSYGDTIVATVTY